MPHSVHSRDLGRNRPWRKATVRSLAQALLKRERMQTTLAKAKEAQRLTERLITLGKDGSLSARRRAQSILNDPPGVRKLFAEIAPRFKTRAGGYTRILHYGNRHGDGAKMAWIELVELGAQIKEKSKPKTSAKEKPASREKPSVVKERPAPVKEKPAPAPEVSEKPPPAPGKKPAKPEQKKPNFVDGLRKFFKPRDKH
ncbi:MAG: 50S ribosomal protein L17 [Candidatus Omnitrophota bacterium]|nr:50S ribosomal protein L17 [Candidatus Omnitrophota bacterium]